MNALLDTCVVSEVQRPRCNPRVRAQVDAIPDEQLFLSVVTLGELVKGVALLDEGKRKRELARLIGVEDRMFVEVEGHQRVYAIADEDLPRENEEKTSSVHFIRFELPATARAAVIAGASVRLGCDHANYPAHVTIAPETLASLAGDLR